MSEVFELAPAGGAAGDLHAEDRELLEEMRAERLNLAFVIDFGEAIRRDVLSPHGVGTISDQHFHVKHEARFERPTVGDKEFASDAERVALRYGWQRVAGNPNQVFKPSKGDLGLTANAPTHADYRKILDAADFILTQAREAAAHLSRRLTAEAKRLTDERLRAESATRYGDKEALQ